MGKSEDIRKIRYIDTTAENKGNRRLRTKRQKYTVEISAEVFQYKAILSNVGKYYSY